MKCKGKYGIDEFTPDFAFTIETGFFSLEEIGMELFGKLILSADVTCEFLPGG